MCKFIYFADVGMPPISVWILVVFSFDKMIHVLNSNRFAFIKKRKFQFGIVGLIFIVHALLYLRIPILLDLQYVNETNVTLSYCRFENFPGYQGNTVLFAIEANIIPFVLMAISTFVTITTLVKSRKNLEKNSKHGTLKDRRDKDTKFAINSIVLNISFVILLTPIVCTYFVNFTDNITYLVVNYTCFLFMCMNYSIGFLINMFSNSLFRKELMLMLGLTKSNQVLGQSKTSSTFTK
jgi:hypothetical protein